MGVSGEELWMDEMNKNGFLSSKFVFELKSAYTKLYKLVIKPFKYTLNMIIGK